MSKIIKSAFFLILLTAPLFFAQGAGEEPEYYCTKKQDNGELKKCTSNAQCVGLGTCVKVYHGGFQPAYNPDTPKAWITAGLNWFLALAAILCVAVLVWAGITYATAGGDEDKVEKAKKRMIYGVIGVAFIIGAFAITQLIKTGLEGNLPTSPAL
ncbi:MAG: pilin [Patescibacteria group bacterium]|nr:pilin [Patescibacteria group bacterium]